MNAEQIIKALECCQTQYDRNCYECPYEKYKTRSISVVTCESILRKDLLSFIKELQAHNENLEKTNKYLRERLAEEAEIKEDMEGN